MQRTKIAELHAQGVSAAEIARRLGITAPTVCYHLRRLGIASDPRFSRRYDWSAVQRYYDLGHSITECQERFGFRARPGTARGGVGPSSLDRRRCRSRTSSLESTTACTFGVVSSPPGSRTRCDVCGIDTWRGLPLTLALHHINGVGDDNRLENLQLLCPNCHSQTDTFAGRNARARLSVAAGSEGAGA